MAHIIKDEEVLRLAIFVILFPGENAFFVWKTPEHSLKRTYKYHYYCENKKTKDLFLKARNEKNQPPMYCLDVLETTHENAFIHCIAWAKFFMERGFRSCCGTFLDKYTEQMGPESKSVYESVRRNELEDVCPVGQDLFPSFGRKNIKREDARDKMINFRLPMEEYAQIRAEAEKVNLTITEYCKKMVMTGRVIIVDSDVVSSFSACLNEFVTRDYLLKNMLSAIYTSKTYYPADMEFVQKAITDNAAQQTEMIEELKEIIGQLLK